MMESVKLEVDTATERVVKEILKHGREMLDDFSDQMNTPTEDLEKKIEDNFKQTKKVFETVNANAESIFRLLTIVEKQNRRLESQGEILSKLEKSSSRPWYKRLFR
jgi:hypothetical protein